MVVRRTQAFIIPPDRVVPADELAAAVRATGYSCDAATNLGQLELNGRALDNYKLDCGGRSYLVTWLDGNSRIKPWSDEILKLSPHSFDQSDRSGQRLLRESPHARRNGRPAST